jgi:uncharacterized membrane protein YfcA
MPILPIIQGGIVALAAAFGYVLLSEPNKKEKIAQSNSSWTFLSIVGVITMFFDTLGIGSYGPLAAIFKKFKTMPDRLIPGTLNTCTVLPTAIEGLIYITIIDVEPITLFSIIISSTLGAFFGAGFVAKLPEKKIQIGLGFALLIVALFMLLGQFKLMPTGGEAIGLGGAKLIVAVIVTFFLGAFMTIGIGIFAPMMALVYALGLSPRVAFPLMMGSCGFLIPVAGMRFVKEDSYDLKSNIAIPLGGILGIFVAAYIVKEIPLYALKWLVIFVLTYTSISMFKSAFSKKTIDSEPPITTV